MSQISFTHFITRQSFFKERSGSRQSFVQLFQNRDAELRLHKLLKKKTTQNQTPTFVKLQENLSMSSKDGDVFRPH